jgi:transcriptional regulator with XRE-family HTH domain
MEIREVFAANLRRFRHKKGLSQEALSFSAGINRSYMSRLEAGRTYAGLKIIADLARVLEVDPADLLAKPKAVMRRRKA